MKLRSAKHGEQIVKPHAQTHRSFAVDISLVNGKVKWQWTHHMRRGSHEKRALRKSLKNETKFKIFQIAETAMNQLRAARRGSPRKIPFLDERDLQSATCGIPGDTGSADSSTNDQKVKNLGSEPSHRLGTTAKGELGKLTRHLSLNGLPHGNAKFRELLRINFRRRFSH